MSTRSSASRWMRATRSPPVRDHDNTAGAGGGAEESLRSRANLPPIHPEPTGMAIERQHHRWFSPSLQREMELLAYGRGGARVLVFPTSQGRFFDWEDRGLVAAMQEHLARGWIQMICVDSGDAESWD